MHVIGVDSWSPRPGTVASWIVRSDEEPQPSTVPPSFNQSAHLADTDDGSTWLAASFDVDGPLDHVALERAVTALIERHDSLRTGFVRTADSVTRVVHRAGALTVRRRPDVVVDSPERARAVLSAALGDACAPFAAPAYGVAAVDRPDVSTVVCGFDHAHVDAWSLALVVDEVRRNYLGKGESSDATASFVAYCADESTGERVDDADPRLRSWVEFLRAGDGAPPRFPLDLAVPVGRNNRCAVRVDTLLDAEESAAIEAVCRARGASLYAGVLASMAHAVRDLGGGSTVPLLFPLHTRRTPERRSAVGWFVTNAPLVVEARSDTGDPVTDVATTVADVGPRLREAVTLGNVPIARVVEAAGGLRRPRKDVFMVSYIDYRALPGHDDMRRVDAHHISSVTVADDAQFWISRTSTGTGIRSRFPDNPTARAVMHDFLTAVVAGLAALQSAPHTVDPRTTAGAVLG